VGGEKGGGGPGADPGDPDQRANMPADEPEIDMPGHGHPVAAVPDPKRQEQRKGKAVLGEEPQRQQADRAADHGTPQAQGAFRQRFADGRQTDHSHGDTGPVGIVPPKR